MSAVLTYEWRRISTLWSTWVLLGCYAAAAFLFGVLPALLTALVASDASVVGSGPDDLSSDTQGVYPVDQLLAAPRGLLAAVFLYVVAAAAFGHEYRFGLIRLTLTAFPDRARVFGAKIAMVLGVLMTAYAAMLGICLLVALALGDRLTPITSAVTGEVARASVVMVGELLIVISVTLLSRLTAIGVVVPVVVSAVGEPLIRGILSYLSEVTTWSALEDVANFMPYTAAGRFVGSLSLFDLDTSPQPVPWAGLVFAAWVVGLVALAWWSFSRRDA